MNQTEAMATASTLAEALEAALRDAQAETDALRRFAHGSVLECAMRREAFNLESVELLGRLKAQLADAPRTPELQRKLDQLRDLSRRLAVCDAVNRDLAGRALVFTQAYLNALLPRAEAYDRRGQSTPQRSSPSSVSARS